MTIIAAIKDPAVIAKIPAHLGLPTRPLPYLVETTVQAPVTPLIAFVVS